MTDTDGQQSLELAIADATAALPRIPSLDAKELEVEYIRLLGRKGGVLTLALKELPTLPQETRRTLGGEANRLRAQVEEAVKARRERLREEAAGRAGAALDLTMPGRRRWVGNEHPVTQVTDEILGIFRELGFVRAVGPEVETEWYNYGALNFPPDHPAMDMHDTLYLDLPEQPGERGGRVLLRTHTSPVQIRTMLAERPPIRIVAPGWVYRRDPFDASHAPVFSQIEGLAVDEGISFVELKATLTHFAHRFFSAATKVRFRPSFFPFTEPSAEMDVACQLCGGGGCSACKGSGWMEILGCGMVHPAVFEHCGVDPEVFSGFAFGMGPHRITMLRYGIPHIRLLYQGDMRFLAQFAAGGTAE